MEIGSIENQKYTMRTPAFASRANPIKPFVVKTKIGDIVISELNYDKELTPQFSKKLIAFFSKIFRKDLSDPDWLNYNNLTRKQKKFFYKCTSDYYNSKLFNPKNYDDLTILTAKDNTGKLQGLCLSYGFDDAPGVKETTMYLDSIAINNKYRGTEIATNMVKSLIESGKNKFTDIFVSADNKVVSFYEKLGFKPLNMEDSIQGGMVKYLRSHHTDEFPLQTQCSIALQKDAERWYDTSWKLINKSE